MGLHFHQGINFTTIIETVIIETSPDHAASMDKTVANFKTQ